MKKITSLLLSLIMLVTSVGVGFYAYAMDISYGVDVSEFNEGVITAKMFRARASPLL